MEIGHVFLGLGAAFIGLGTGLRWWECACMVLGIVLIGTGFGLLHEVTCNAPI